MIFTFFSDFSKHYSIVIRTSSPKQALSLHRSKSRQREQVVCDNGAAHTSHKSVPPGPSRPKQTKSSFEHGDVGFDTGPEVPELLVNPAAFHHLQDRYPLSLSKSYVTDSRGFTGFEVALGSESAIGAHLPWVAPVSFFLLIHEGYEHGCVGGIASLDQAAQNQAGLSTGKENLVTVGRFPVSLLNDVSMTFKKGNDLLARRNPFPVDYSASGLVHDPGQKTVRSRQFLNKNPRMDNMFRVGRFKSFQDRNRTFSVAPNQLCKAKQILVARLANCFIPAIFDLEDSFFDHPPVVAEAIAWSRGKGFALDEKPSDDTNTVLQKGGVSWIVDIALNRRGIDTHGSSLFDSSFGRVGYDRPVDCLPSLFAQRLDVLLQSRGRGALPPPKPGKGAKCH